MLKTFCSEKHFRILHGFEFATLRTSSTVLLFRVYYIVCEKCQHINASDKITVILLSIFLIHFSLGPEQFVDGWNFDTNELDTNSWAFHFKQISKRDIFNFLSLVFSFRLTDPYVITNYWSKKSHQENYWYKLYFIHWEGKLILKRRRLRVHTIGRESNRFLTKQIVY